MFYIPPAQGGVVRIPPPTEFPPALEGGKKEEGRR